MASNDGSEEAFQKQAIAWRGVAHELVRRLGVYKSINIAGVFATFPGKLARSVWTGLTADGIYAPITGDIDYVVRVGITKAIATGLALSYDALQTIRETYAHNSRVRTALEDALTCRASNLPILRSSRK